MESLQQNVPESNLVEPEQNSESSDDKHDGGFGNLPDLGCLMSTVI